MQMSMKWLPMVHTQEFDDEAFFITFFSSITELNRTIDVRFCSIAERSIRYPGNQCKKIFARKSLKPLLGKLFFCQHTVLAPD